MRRVGLILVVAALATLGGCVGFVTGSEPLNVSSERAALAPDAVEEAGYEMSGSQTRSINESFRIAGQERSVNARVHVSSYTRAPDVRNTPKEVNTSSAIEGAGTLTVISVPGVDVAGASMNPLRILPDDLLFELAGQQGADIEASGSTSVTMLGEQVEGRTYSVSMDGTSVTLERASVSHEGDLVIAVAAYPEGGESPRELMAAVEHPA